MDIKKYDNKFNIAIVGNSNVGKSTYIKRLIDDTFMCLYKKTSGIETHHIPKSIKGKSYLFKIWDINGDTKPYNISNDLYRTVDSFIFTIAINDPESFEDIKEWIDAIIAKKAPIDNSIMLCLKSDLESDKLNINNIKKTCEDYEIELYEVSSKTNSNVNNSFEKIIEKVLLKNFNLTNFNSFNTNDTNSGSNCSIF